MNKTINESIAAVRSLAAHIKEAGEVSFANDAARKLAIAALNVVADECAAHAARPTPEEVTEFSASIGYPLDGEAWCDHYAIKGWTQGNAPVSDWRAAVRIWARNGWGQKDGIALGGVR